MRRPFLYSLEHRPQREITPAAKVQLTGREAHVNLPLHSDEHLPTAPAFNLTPMICPPKNYTRESETIGYKPTRRIVSWRAKEHATQKNRSFAS